MVLGPKPGPMVSMGVFFQGLFLGDCCLGLPIVTLWWWIIGVCEQGKWSLESDVH